MELRYHLYASLQGDEPRLGVRLSAIDKDKRLSGGSGSGGCGD